MGTRQGTIDFLLGQMAGAPGVSARKMFGEFALYYDGKLVALVCDDQLYFKTTPAGRAHAPDAAEAPPYPGAKSSLLIEGDRWEDMDWLAALVRLTASQLPVLTQRPKKKARARVEKST